ncbi:MAG TPA: hyaluronate lyase [Desulfotomaculum sp.]|nr:hyaluronate lyase [Desulfotomaculum sp.]
MSRQIIIDPITRTSSRGHVEVTIEQGKVVAARLSTLFFRGFEIMLRGRDPRDAPYLTQRICGICAAGHATAAAYALEDLAGVRPPRNGHLLRNLILTADTLQNHIRHFYLFAMPDFVRGPERSPFIPRYRHGYRLAPKIETRLMEHYFEAVKVSRIAHEFLAALGGKAPFVHGILPGGATVPPDGALVLDLRAKLDTIGRFIKEKMVSDLQTVSEAYREYYKFGRRPLRILVHGFLPVDPERKRFHFPTGVVEEDGTKELDASAIAEHLRHAYFKEDAGPQPAGQQETTPQPGKSGAYSWIKAPRYNGRPFEGGPLARLWVAGCYRRGISAMDRLTARVKETEILCGLMKEWLEELAPGEPVFTPFKPPKSGEGLGLTDSMRGPLLHYVQVEGGRISRYEIITPSAWNFSPRDDAGRPGPVEEALLGTPVADPGEPIEIGRIIRSFDPCFSCATHIIQKE